MKKIQHELSGSQQFKTLIKEPVIKELFLYKDSSNVSYLTTDTLLIQQHIRECFMICVENTRDFSRVDESAFSFLLFQ